MTDHHSHTHHHHHSPTNFGYIFALGISANTLYLIAEILIGLYTHSIALISDGEHNFSDVLALSASWLAYYLTRKAPSPHFTYGLGRSSILITVGNACLLMLVTGGVILESCERFFDMKIVMTTPVMITAALGIIVNSATALLFMSGSKGDLNIKSAFIHLASDAAIAASVLIAAFLMAVTHQLWIDPLVSLVISTFIIYSTWSVLKEAIDMALDGVPHNIDPEDVKKLLLSFPTVTALHDLHIWPISTTQTALTVHLVCQTTDDVTRHKIQAKIADALFHQFSIVHPTLQVEMRDCGVSCHPHEKKHS